MLLVGLERGFALPLFVQHPAMGVVQALVQLVTQAAGLLQGGRNQRLKGGPELGGKFVSALESASFFPKISSSHLKSITSSLDFHYDHSRTC